MKTLIKILVVALLCTTLLITGVSGAFATQDSDNSVYIGKIGDNDGTDVVTVKDATRIQKYLVSIIKFSEKAKILADVDSDGKVTIKDASEIQKWIGECSDNTLINSPFYCEAYFIYIRTADADTGKTVGGYAYGIYSDEECTVLLEEVISHPGMNSAYSKDKYIPGTYYIKQISTAANYESDTNVYNIEVSKENATTDCVWAVIHSKQAPKRLYIKAYDEDNYNPSSPLTGAEFGVYSDKDCNNLISIIAGQFSERIFEVGETYYLKVLTAPAGYNLNETVYEVTIPNAQYLDMVSVTVYYSK